MAADARAALIEQLPKYNPWTWERFLNAGGALASVAAFVFVFFNIDKLSNDTKIIVAITYLFIIIVFLVAYLLVLTYRKLHRYAQAVFHLHLVNHVIRDHLGAIELGQEPDKIVDVVRQILDSVAACYSILTGRLCRVTLKEITVSSEVRTVARDSMSAATISREPVHALEKNTAFRNIWYGIGGCSRYFHSNNLLRDWRSRQYENTSFETYGGHPKLETFLGVFSYVSDWKLPYRSTMVFPIRYVHDWKKWPLEPGDTGVSQEPVLPQIWGFLCVDSASRGAFRPPHASEVGGAFADSLYVLFTYALEKRAKEATG